MNRQKFETPSDSPFPQWSRPGDIIDSISNPQIREFLTAIISQMGLVDADARPQWANHAAMEFWRCLFGKYPSQEFYGIGFLCGIIHPRLDENDAIGSMSGSDILNKFISVAVNENSPEAADFLHGYGDGRNAAKMVTELNFLQLFQPQHTWKIYMLIAFAWRACVEFKNVRQWRVWLISVQAVRPGAPENEEAEINSLRNLLRRLGVPLTDRGGRPKGKTHTRRKIRRVS